MSHEKQFTLFTHFTGPNGWKVAIILEELGLSYEPIYLDFNKGEHKAPEYTKYNPNGRTPTIIDHHNNNFVIWESNAILMYLVEKYDKEHKISVSDTNEKHSQLQWLFFQASGQGPYYGQAYWFFALHSEKVPSALDRYRNEMVRVTSVLESVLSKQEWLVGGKATIADLSFYTWNFAYNHPFMADTEGFKFNLERDFPHVYAWHNKIAARRSVKKIDTQRAGFRK